MPRRHPTLWLMTDERMGDALWGALERLPRGAGVVFRHHATSAAARRALFRRALSIARRRGLVLVRAGHEYLPGEMGVHGRGRMARPGLRTWPAHSRAEAIAGLRAGADLIFVSPIFTTRSHPDARALGPLRAAKIARGLPVAIALGGMNQRRFVALLKLGFAGWAAIDALRCRERLR